MSKKIKIEIDYDIGDTVFMVTDEEQFERLVTEIKLTPNTGALYKVVCGVEEKECYAIELSDKKKLWDEKD